MNSIFSTTVSECFVPFIKCYHSLFKYNISVTKYWQMKQKSRKMSHLTYVRAFCRATMKSGFPPLKTSLALAWTQIQDLVLLSSLK